MLLGVSVCPNLCGNLYIHLYGMVESGWVHVAAAVALVNSRALHCFVLEQLLTSFGLPVVSGEGMEMMLSDGS